MRSQVYDNHSRSAAGMFPVRTGFKVIIALSCFSLLVSIYIYVSTSKYVNQLQEKKENVSLLDFSSQWSRLNRSNNATDFWETVPLLTLFTTWPEGGNKTRAWNNTLKNWASFKPLVQPVFFYTNERQAKDIARHGWDVLPVRRTAVGLPVLKQMFLDAVDAFNSMFYGYSNGDIIFDDGLLNTLFVVEHSYLPAKKPVLITGIRTNVANLTEKETSDFKSLAGAAKERGTLFMTASEDYFITDVSYPWADIPELVIGRVAYDNWLVLNARQQDHTVIDATETLTAVHQTTQTGNFEGWQSPNVTYNSDILSRLYGNVPYEAGCTVCAPWMTKEDKKGNITVVRRTMLETKCIYKQTR